MKTKQIIITFTVLTCLSVLSPQLSTGLAQGTAFTYQGRLTDTGQPASGSYDLIFGVFNASSGGSQVGNTLTNIATAVSNGLFSVTLDFGSGVFIGPDRWLEIAARTNGATSFTTLAPRQPILPVPYAIFANTASNLSGTVPASQLSGMVANGQLAHSSVLINAGAGLSGGGSVALGTSTTLNNAGVLSVTGNSDITASTVSGAVTLGDTATSANTASTIVKRDTSGNFSAGNVTAVNFTGNGSGLTGVVPADNSVTSAKIADGTIVDADISATGISGNKIIGGDLQARRLNVGINHILNGTNATIAGGQNNTALGTNATICGGGYNMIQTNADWSTIGGGVSNKVDYYSDYSTIGGGEQNTIQINASQSTIGGGWSNSIGSVSPNSTIGGGWHNSIADSANNSTIGGGTGNTIQTYAGQSTISGGQNNTIQTNSNDSVISGGWNNIVMSNSPGSTIGGGSGNVVMTNSVYSTIGGGYSNTNLSYALAATIPGGINNSATNYAFAAGNRAKAIHTGSFVWGDSTDADIVSTNGNSVTMRAAGGYRLFSNSGATAGAYLAPGGGSWTSISDRNAKEEIQPVNPMEMLNKVVALPVATWKYKSQDASVRHIGPMAQDFKAAFAVGESDTGITTVDADGVALAAIQGLNQKLELKETEIKELKARLERLEQLFSARNGGGK